MNFRTAITILTIIVGVFSTWAAIKGIAPVTDKAAYDHLSIRQQNVEIYGIGLYKHMPADVAVQGIAQDYITLFLAVPLLLFGGYFLRSGGPIGSVV